jgi:flagellar biosynthetic protein FliR
MDILFNQLLTLMMTLWWPFCRVLAMLSAAPVVGELMVPVTVRVLLSLVIAFILLPATNGMPVINPWSMHGIAVTVEQAMIGGMIGLAFHLTYAVMMVLGYLISSQIGFAMAVMNDPMNGASSDVISNLLYVLTIVVFFGIDGHLVLVNIVGASFKTWPIGSGIDTLSLQTLVFNVSWVFSAALLLAIPIVFSTFVVQMGTGLLNRVAPSFNLFSLGFSLVTLFGLFMLTHMVRFIPEHYLRMTNQVLDMLQHSFRTVPHG